MPLIEIPAGPQHRELFHAYHHQRGFLDQALDGLDGQLWVDDPNATQAALIYNVFCFLGGDPQSQAAPEVIAKAVALAEPVVAPDPGWQALIEAQFGEHYTPAEWHSFTSKGLDIEHVRRLKAQLPPDVRVQRIDRDVAHQLFDAKIRVFRTYGHDPDRFIDEGIGFYARQGEQIISIVNTMAIYDGKVKGYIDTHPRYRRQGLATAVAAHLVEHCWEQQLDYCWEATNPHSARVAERLGLQEDARIRAYMPRRA